MILLDSTKSVNHRRRLDTLANHTGCLLFVQPRTPLRDMRVVALAKTFAENGARHVVDYTTTQRVVAPRARELTPRSRRMRVQASPVTVAPAPPSTPRFSSDITADGVDALVSTIVADYERALRDASRGTTWESTFSTTLRALGRASEASAGGDASGHDASRT